MGLLWQTHQPTKIMNCDAYRILISGYIDNELSDDEMQSLKAHLPTCEACLLHLKQMEAMQTRLKRYTLFQDLPETSPNFARKITDQLEKALQEEQLSIAARLRNKYRSFVFNIIELWVNSLQTRPFTWTTSVSCLLVLVMGLAFFDVSQRISLRQSPQFEAEVPTSQSVIPIAQQDEQQQIRSQEVAESKESFPVVNVGSEPSISAPILEAQDDQFVEMVEVVKVAEEPFVRIAHNESSSVDDYVYSHVIEVYQDQFVDDAVFVGYVQNTILQ
jgi:hypothetical protein